MKTEADIIVYEAPNSLDVLAAFDTIEEFESWMGRNYDIQIFADQVSINGCIMYSWDEIDTLIKPMK